MHNSHLRRPDIPVAVYRMYAADGALLYVGQSAMPQNRLMQHRLSSSWVTEVATITVSWFSSRREATVAEMAAIKAENPRHNLDHLVSRDDVQRPTSGSMLGRWLTDKGVSVRDFAAQVGVSPDRIRRIVANKSKPNGHLPDLISQATDGHVPPTGWDRRRSQAKGAD